jgi:outer membrane protein assembly factor BamB
MKSLFLIAAAAAAALAMTALAMPTVRAADTAGKFEDLGVQITSMTLQGTTFAKDPAGRHLVCTVIRGEPAKLLVFDVKSGELLHRLTLTDAHGAWNATTASDGSVYVGTDDNGHLFRWIPGEKELKNLGQVARDQTFVWDVTPGADGEVFCGTYPGCQVIRYHPTDGFSDVGKGPVAPGEDYVRALSYDPASKHVFAGVGAKAHLIELDPATGEKHNILSPRYKAKKFAYGVDVVAGKLFTMLTDETATIVIDLATREEEATIPCGLQIISGKSPYGEHVYFNSGGTVSRYDLTSRKHEVVGAIGNIPVIALGWVTFDEPDFPGQTLVAMTSRGKLVRYHPQTGKSDAKQLDVPPENVPIQSIVAGPDGNIYSGGYLVGGFTRFDPATGKHQQIGNAGQPEGMCAYGDNRIYLGVYPRARLKVFDVTKPYGDDNPRQFEELDRFDQDRPFAVLGVEPLKKVFFGTISDYGALGGAIAVHDVESGKTDVYRNVVPDHSVSSLAYADGMIVGATSVAGGLGIEPKEKEAKLFLWDPSTREKVFETPPVAGAGLITGLMVGPDKNIWGITSGELFVFDVSARKVASTRRLFPKDKPTRVGWRDAHLTVHPDGRVYGASQGRLFRVDPKTMEMTVLRHQGGLGMLALDRDGRVYFRERTNLWRYTP